MKTEAPDRAVAQLTKNAALLGSLEQEMASTNAECKLTAAELRREIFSHSSWADDPNDSTMDLLRDFRRAVGKRQSVENPAAKLEALKKRQQQILEQLPPLRAALDKDGAEILREVRARCVAAYHAEVETATSILLPLYRNSRSQAREVGMRTPNAMAAFRRVPGDWTNLGSDTLGRAQALIRILKASSKN